MNDRELQQALQSIGYYKGKLDGDLGKQSMAAIENFLGVGRVGFRSWATPRVVLAAKQLVVKQAGFDPGIVDGLMGPGTRYAFERYGKGGAALAAVTTWRDEQAPLVPVDEKSAKPEAWPTQANVTKFYGEVGKNQTIMQLPYPMRIAWDKSKVVTRISIHEKVADSATRVLKRVASEYSPASLKEKGLDLFGGCLNVRKMRGGSAWSMHSWGIAIDFDPERNQLKWGRDKARLAYPDCATFWKLWEEEGWVSLGRARNYDWMHVQAARL